MPVPLGRCAFFVVRGRPIMTTAFRPLISRGGDKGRDAATKDERGPLHVERDNLPRMQMQFRWLAKVYAPLARPLRLAIFRV